MILAAYDIVDRITERYIKRCENKPCETRWTLLRFIKRKIFDEHSSATTPRNFMSIIDVILSRKGFLPLGASEHKAITERGLGHPVTVNTVYLQVRNWLEGRRDEVNFTNLYSIFLIKYESLSGMLYIGRYAYLIFIPGLQDYHSHLCFSLTGVSRENKKRVKELSQAYGLEFWGGPSQPVLYRRVKPPISADEVTSFINDVTEFFEDTGYPEI